MQMVIDSKYDYLKPFISVLPEIFSENGETIYKARNEIKVMEVEDLIVNVKQYKVPILPNRIIYTWFRQPKARRAYEYAERLKALGIRTATPLAYIILRRYGMIHQSYFVSLQLEGQPLYEVGKLPIEKTKDIFEALGKYVATLHNKGIYHADFSPGNVLYEKTPSGYEFYLIDINRMSFGNVGASKGYENFARLWGCTDAFRIMAKSYAEARGLDVEKSTDMILKYRDRFWKKYRRKHPVKFTY